MTNAVGEYKKFLVELLESGELLELWAKILIKNEDAISPTEADWENIEIFQDRLITYLRPVAQPNYPIPRH